MNCKLHIKFNDGTALEASNPFSMNHNTLYLTAVRYELRSIKEITIKVMPDTLQSLKKTIREELNELEKHWSEVHESNKRIREALEKEGI